MIGRFLTPDPAGFVDGPNLYAYVLNDPINTIDPIGLSADDPNDPGEIIVTGRRRGNGSFVDVSACFTRPGYCTYHGGYITYLGPAPAAPQMMMQAEERMERLCDSINSEVERTRNAIGDFSFNNPEALRLDRAVVQLDLQVIGKSAAFLGVSVTGANAASAIPVKGTTSLRFTRAGVGAGLAAGFLGFLVSRDLAEIAAIDARLRQLDAEAAGICE